MNIEFDPLKLAAILAEKNVSQAELARRMGYTHRNIVSRIIAGRRGVTAADSKDRQELCRTRKHRRPTPRNSISKHAPAAQRPFQAIPTAGIAPIAIPTPLVVR